MNSKIYLNFKNPLVLFFCISLLFIFNSNAQNEDKKETEQSDVKANEVISLDQISDQAEKLGQRIFNLRDILKPSADVHVIDSLTILAEIDIIKAKDSVIQLFDSISARDLDAIKVEWKKYHSTLKGYQSTLKDRSESITEINDELVEEYNKWTLTKSTLQNSNSSKDVSESLDKVIANLQDITNVALERLDEVFSIQNKITNLLLIIDSLNSEIAQVEKNIQRDYFTIDALPIWKLNQTTSTEVTNLAIDSKKTEKNFKSKFSKDMLQLKEFISYRVGALISQIALILFLILLMFRVHKSWETEDELTNPIENEAKIVVSHPFSSSLVVGLLISAYFYGGLIPIFKEIHILLVLISTIILLPQLTVQKFRVTLFLLLIIYLERLSEVYISANPLTTRLLSISTTLLLIIALIHGRKVIKQNPNSFKQFHKLFNFIAPLYISLLIISIAINCIGMVGLSNFLFKGVFISTLFSVVVYLIVKVVTGLAIILFKLKKTSSNIQTLSTMVNVTNKRLQPTLFWAGFLYWIYFTLVGFETYDNLLAWVNETLLIDWKIGEMTISLGGILAFSSIFIITLLLAKLAASIFQDEWMIKTLPRGIAPAISLILRIIVISLGFYMALSAAGIDLSKIGFILGTLGVGIGFGLQNVVLNFVAGLILAFERPVNLGDVIEVDQEKGVITNIGVRSSNIRTYTGAEAIIPNGDLISKKVINWTLTNRDRRSRILMKTSPNADPEKVIELFNTIAIENEKTFKDPAPKTYFYGYNVDGNLDFALMYWTTFSDTISVDHDIALKLFKKLKEEGIDAPIPTRRIIK